MIKGKPRTNIFRQEANSQKKKSGIRKQWDEARNKNGNLYLNLKQFSRHLLN